jgi:hypothetical protein
VTIVAVIVVRRTALDAFRRFETAAAAVMRGHGGAIERVIVEDDGAADTLREVHVVTFPSADAWSTYRADPALAALAALRAEAVVSTELVIGEDAPAYR